MSVSQTTTGMELSWTAPEVTSGEAVTGYKVYRDDGAGGAVDVVAYDSRENSGDFVSTSCSVSGLTGGLTYTYEVSALSLAGESDRSSSMTSPTSPLQVSGVGSTSQTTGSITLSWSAPSATGGNEASGYMVYHDDGVGGSEMSTVGYDGSSSTSTSGTITGLVGGREYSFVVSALSRGGEGDVSDVLLQSTSPAAPTALASTVQTTTSISLSWTAPVTETGGAGVTGYVLYRNDGSTDGPVSIEVPGASGGATTTTSGESFEVTGLSGGVEYQFSVAARSSAGLGDRSEVVRVSTSSAKPDPPTATHQTASSITLSWSAPTVGTGEASTGYQVYMVTVAAGTTEPVYTVVYDGAGSEATSVELTSLDSGSLYTYVLSSLSA
ncbi:MAG: fibronectin type III domain-containing protein, partial [Actinomycetota bacterium]|nr:fibronectin type III domain-containing protein [Actinomycetota bacterium]